MFAPMRSRLVAVVVALFALGPVANAKKKPAPPAKPPTAPSANEKAVSELLGNYRWGMSPDDVLAALTKSLNERHAQELAKTSDIYEQNRLRKKIKADVDVVRKSFVRFEGQRTGWDVSIIEGEFLQRNDEAMMVYKETDPTTGRDQQRFFFFHGGKLWKQFIAFDMAPYKGKTFDDFRAAMETRYGVGAPIVKKAADGTERTVAVKWRSGSTALRAIDLMQFYANFCLAFSDAATEEKLDAIRLARAPKAGAAGKASSVKYDGRVADPNADVIDRITQGVAPASQPQ